MKYINSFSLNFSPEKKMEAEYAQTKEQHIFQDFKATVNFLILLNLVLVITSLIDKNILDLTISSTSIAALLIMFFLRKRLAKYALYMLLIVTLYYNVSRLFIFSKYVDNNSKINIFYSAYALASMQIILVTRITKIQYKILMMIGAFALRFSLLLDVFDGSVFPIPTFVRHILIDVFIVYIFYSSEKAERKVFQNSYENREELLKFKELLADSLPMSITVLDIISEKSLFSNNTFLSSFEPLAEPQTPFSTNQMRLPSIEANSDSVRPQMDYLQVDQATIRELGATSPTLNCSQDSSITTYLKDIIVKLAQESKLNDKALSLTAYYTCLDQRKSFQVTLKRIRWDRKDAVAIILNDITYQENLIALKMSNQNKDKVIATVSHELRTPLNGILGLVGMAEEKVQHPEVMEYLSLCKDNANLLLSLVNSILDLQQVAAGKLKLSPARIDIRKTLTGVVKLFQFQCHQKGIYLEPDIRRDVPHYVITDENRLKQILINLVGNAIKFTFKGGIKIEVMQNPQDQDCLKISVVDTGIGIKDEDKGKLFKMYGKLKDGEGVNKNGVGLGLTISNVLAAVLRGNTEGKGIEVESEYGVGSKFIFGILKDLLKYSEHQGEAQRDGIHISSLDFQRLKDQSKNNQAQDRDKDFVHSIEEENLDSQYCEELAIPIEIELKLARHISLQKISTENLNRICKISIHGITSEEGFNTYMKPEKVLMELKEAQRASRKLIKPIRLEESQINLIGETPRSNIFAKKNCILVVDDNPFNLLVAENLVKNSGYAAKFATGGQEAIEIVKSASEKNLAIKAIILDCQMPIMDGYETAAVLRNMMEKNEIPNIPILGWTANNAEEDIKKCYDSGMVDYLSKPSSQNDFLKALAKLE